MRPEVLGEIAESSPSIRPLTASTPGGSDGAAKNRRQAANPPAATAITSAPTISARRRVPGFDSSSAGGAAGGASRTGGSDRSRSAGVARTTPFRCHESVDAQILDVLHVRGRLGDLASYAAFREEARPQRRRREKEEKASDETQMGQQRIDRPEAPFPDTALDDATDHVGHAQRRGDQLRIEVSAARQHLA